MTPAHTCTACRGTDLEPGFSTTAQQPGGYARWVRGSLSVGIFGGAKAIGKEKLPIEVWRCRACGHLEQYAFEQRRGDGAVL